MLGSNPKPKAEGGGAGEAQWPIPSTPPEPFKARSCLGILPWQKNPSGIDGRGARIACSGPECASKPSEASSEPLGALKAPESPRIGGACPFTHTGTKFYRLLESKPERPRVKSVRIVKGAIRDWKVKVSIGIRPGGGSGKRGKVSATMSEASKGRMCFAIRNADFQGNPWMITLTQADSPSGPEWVRRIKAFREFFRRSFPGVKGLWFRESQQRGALHLHAFTTAPGGRKIINKRGKVIAIDAVRVLFRGWSKIVTAGGGRTLIHCQSWERMKSESGAARYAAKYATKREQKTGPEDAGRWWGWLNWGTGPDLVDESEEIVSESLTEAVEKFFSQYGITLRETEIGGRWILPHRYQWHFGVSAAPGDGASQKCA